jgi:hypothetical protein
MRDSPISPRPAGPVLAPHPQRRDRAVAHRRRAPARRRRPPRPLERPDLYGRDAEVVGAVDHADPRAAPADARHPPGDAGALQISAPRTTGSAAASAIRSRSCRAPTTTSVARPTRTVVGARQDRDRIAEAAADPVVRGAEMRLYGRDAEVARPTRTGSSRCSSGWCERRGRPPSRPRLGRAEASAVGRASRTTRSSSAKTRSWSAWRLRLWSVPGRISRSG